MTTTPRSRVQKARGLLPQVRRLATNVRLAYERRETTATDRAWLCAFGDALDQFLSSGETTLSGGADPRTWQRARKSAPKRMARLETRVDESVDVLLEGIFE